MGTSVSTSRLQTPKAPTSQVKESKAAAKVAVVAAIAGVIGWRINEKLKIIQKRVQPQPAGATKLQHPAANPSDLDLAFELQMKEAMSTSAAASTSASNSGGGRELSEQFSLYFKGLVVEEARLGAIGVAIFDSSNAVVFKASKPLDFPEAEMRDEVAELEAFVEGLEFALNLEIKNVMCACLDFNLYPYLYGNQKPKEAKVAQLADRAILLKKYFVQCYLSAATENNAELVLELARSSIAKQAGKPFKEITLTNENCPICLEEIDAKKLFEIGGCKHRFCFSCIQKHVRLKVRSRKLPRCPQLKCGSELNIKFCKNFLSQKLGSIMEHLANEASIPTTERVYCPNPRCSHLMSKTEALAISQSLASTSSAELTACRCVKCRKLFCINCKVLWHANMSCDEYKKKEMDSMSADAKLKLLAINKKWRQCPRCYHMVELALGCNHIYCRCGHEFCYLCGLEWKNKKPTCTCILWSEENIIRQNGAN